MDPTDTQLMKHNTQTATLHCSVAHSQSSAYRQLTPTAPCSLHQFAQLSSLHQLAPCAASRTSTPLMKHNHPTLHCSIAHSQSSAHLPWYTAQHSNRSMLAPSVRTARSISPCSRCNGHERSRKVSKGLETLSFTCIYHSSIYEKCGFSGF